MYLYQPLHSNLPAQLGYPSWEPLVDDSLQLAVEIFYLVIAVVSRWGVNFFVYHLGKSPFVSNEYCDVFMYRHGKGSFVNNEYFDIFAYITLQVVHDCRKMSDMLWHQYQVQMVNVFDTQVGNMVSEVVYRYSFNLFFQVLYNTFTSWTRSTMLLSHSPNFHFVKILALILWCNR